MSFVISWLNQFQFIMGKGGWKFKGLYLYIVMVNLHYIHNTCSPGWIHHSPHKFLGRLNLLGVQNLSHLSPDTGFIFLSSSHSPHKFLKLLGIQNLSHLSPDAGFMFLSSSHSSPWVHNWTRELLQVIIEIITIALFQDKSHLLQVKDVNIFFLHSKDCSFKAEILWKISSVSQGVGGISSNLMISKLCYNELMVHPTYGSSDLKTWYHVVGF